MCPPVRQRPAQAPPAKRQALETVPHPQNRGRLMSPKARPPKMQRRPRPPVAKRRRFPRSPQQVERPILPPVESTPQDMEPGQVQSPPQITAVIQLRQERDTMRPPIYLPALLANCGPAGLLRAHRLPQPKPPCQSRQRPSPDSQTSPC
ncbi:UNVERIFIED_ASMBLY: BLLF2 [human gammaherpesvirus 4]|uniref:Uncharacterized protein BLLF2 n=2 Tax=Epstein-Barr virus (strain GD1) TaxID=10376 RepID=BLLF2_EBVG|nr:RecName: Full=Uncharacterized protein BLLF2 [human gammaherpesvirus 4]AAY41117.1 unknown [human gammaherpesvirus 4]AIE88755.1 BLLF2 [human gammaherpesvirus 4]AIE88832.1 BLLF2 [human gammaherpesvirus 4]AIM62209.1 BLLF2 [human gammaherpesvirus 4]ALV82758.1 BLLF2 [human gammaherpesvirus 4]